MKQRAIDSEGVPSRGHSGGMVRHGDDPLADTADWRDLPPQRILIVDDDPMILTVLRLMVESDNHAVVVAKGGMSGIEAFLAAKASAEPFSVVMTDLGMPGMDGLQVASAVKAASPGTLVLLLTGCIERLTAEGGQLLHVDQVLSKPPRRQELRDALTPLLRHAEPGSREAIVD